MRLPISAGSAVVFAMLTLGSAPATACGWGGWGGCGCAAYGYGYGYDDYGGQAYAYDAPPAYYARPAYAYAPPAYYAPPPAYYAPPVYHAGPTFASYAPPGYAPPPPGYYAPPTFGVPYAGRGGYNAAAGPNRPKLPMPAFIPSGRGHYPFAGKPSPRVIQPPRPYDSARAISASADNPRWRGSSIAVAYQGGRGGYVPTAHTGGRGGYVGARRH
jgi:hypothetical protein